MIEGGKVRSHSGPHGSSDGCYHAGLAEISSDTRPPGTTSTLQKKLLKNFGLTLNPTVIRAPTFRPDICYHVIALPRSHPRLLTAADSAINLALVLKKHLGGLE